MSQMVIFATPSLSHSVSLDFKRAWARTIWLLKDNGIPHGYIDRGGDCFVAKARNKLVQQFLDGDGTDFFSLDDDIGWEPEKVVEFCLRPEPILEGIYPKKSDSLDWPVGLESDVETGELITDQGLFRAGFASAGFMRIKREVLESLAANAARFKDIEMDGEVADYPLIFNAGLNADGWWCGEDVAFCRYARAMGFETWVDPNIEFKHRGGKTWSGKLSDHLETFRQKAKLAREHSAKDAA